MYRWNTPPVRVAGIYLLVSVIYIVISDWLVEEGVWIAALPAVQTLKGVVFVFLSAILIYVLSARELRRRQAAEKLLLRAQRMEAVGQLTNGVAHDFNNFLTVIFGNLELIHQGAGANSTLRDQVDNALLAAERGAALTRRLLAFSRGQSHEPQQIEIKECLLQLKSLLDCVLGEGIVVETDLADDLPPILADRAQLEATVLNLGLNARDAMPHGGTILLTSRAAKLTSDLTCGNWQVPKGNYVMISVKDDGIGMSQGVQDRLLEPFFTTKPVGKGTGLGFPMAYSFVKQSGGHLVVRSDVDQGASVALYFPIASRDKRAARHYAITSEDRLGDETILVVENDIAVRDVLNTLLIRLGYNVLLASQASEARELLTGKNHVDVLLTDIVLGCEQNGIELANEIRHDHPSLPVLLVSGAADSSITCELSNTAPVRCLEKPFSSKQVSQALREMLDH